MKDKEFDFGGYLTGGVERIVKGAVRATLTDPRESMFMAKFALSSREASRRRARAEAGGGNIPPFLIASITSSCNLHCAGCYSRQNHACTDAEPVDQLTAQEWGDIFSDARELGISFILLAGGEPLLRRDVIEAAGDYPEILFPIFTNGTLLDDGYIRLFDKKRNLLPILSIEGRLEKTDARRGTGVYMKVKAAMERIRKDRLIFGASVTATTVNLREITGREFLDGLQEEGCKAVIYVEFVPVTEESKDLAPGDAEPCPFSPYSDINVRDTSLRRALCSPLFAALRERDVLMEEHNGGCVLFERRESVEAILAESAGKIGPVSSVG